MTYSSTPRHQHGLGRVRDELATTGISTRHEQGDGWGNRAEVPGSHLLLPCSIPSSCKHGNKTPISIKVRRSIIALVKRMMDAQLQCSSFMERRERGQWPYKSPKAHQRLESEQRNTRIKWRSGEYHRKNGQTLYLNTLKSCVRMQYEPISVISRDIGLLSRVHDRELAWLDDFLNLRNLRRKGIHRDGGHASMFRACRILWTRRQKNVVLEWSAQQSLTSNANSLADAICSSQRQLSRPEATITSTQMRLVLLNLSLTCTNFSTACSNILRCCWRFVCGRCDEATAEKKPQRKKPQREGESSLRVRRNCQLQWFRS